MQITLTNQEARKLYALAVDICASPTVDMSTLKIMRDIRAKISVAYAKQKKQDQDAEEMVAAMLGLTTTR